MKNYLFILLLLFINCKKSNTSSVSESEKSNLIASAKTFVSENYPDHKIEVLQEGKHTADTVGKKEFYPVIRDTLSKKWIVYLNYNTDTTSINNVSFEYRVVLGKNDSVDKDSKEAYKLMSILYKK